VIGVADVRVVFGRTIALDHVTLDIPPGITGLYGPNGSGKSTLLRVIAGLLRPARGSISFDGSAHEASDEGLRRKLGYSGHEPGLYGRLTIQENLELFAALCGAEPGRVDDTITRIGLEDRATARVDELSAGLKKRASIARAMVHDPTFLLLDEPFATLDDESAERVVSAIRSWSSPERTAVIATHGAKRLKSFAEGTVVLRQGLVANAHRDDPAEVGA
jgi:heme exporter protein A